jgi:dTDP-L-rhamnose 4-epimerase
MKILVTGGAGFVGSHLVDGLLEQGHEVRVLDNLDPQVHGPDAGRPEHLAPEAELQIGDVRDRAAVGRALEGVEAVYHQAAAVGVGQSMYQIEHYVSVNSLGAAVLLEEILGHRDQIQKLVVASSMSIYGEGAYRDPESGTILHPALRPESQLAAREFDFSGSSGAALEPIPTPEEKPLLPTSVYAVTKRDHEELFLAVGAGYGIPTTALRYFNIYGARQSLNNPYTGVIAIFSSRLLNRNRPLIFEDGAQSRDFVHVSDIVRANLLALTSPASDGRVYNIGTGRRTSILEVAETLAAQLDFPDPPEVVGSFRAGDIRHCYADVTRAAKELGFTPQVNLEEGMRDLLGWLRTQHAEDRVDEATRELAQRGLTR